MPKYLQNKIRICLYILPILICNTNLFANIDSLKSIYNQKLFQQNKSQIDILSEISWEYRRKSADSTIHYAGLALKLAKHIDYKKGKAVALKNMGVGYSIEGNVDSTFHYMEAALNLSKEIQDDTLIAKSLNNLGLAFHHQGLYERALKIYIESLHYSEKINDPIYGVTLMNIGFLNQRTGKYADALKFYHKALEFAEQENNTTHIASCLYNIGGIHSNLGDLEKAKYFFNLAKNIADKNDDLLLESKILLSIARLYKKQEKYLLATSVLNSTYILAQEIHNQETIAQVLQELGLIDFKNKDYEKALEKAQKAIIITRKTTNRELLKNTLRLAADSYAAMAEYKMAYKIEQEFLEVSNKIFNKEKANKLRALEIEHSLEESAKELALLRASTTEKEALIKQKSAQLSIAVLFVLLIALAASFFWILQKSEHKQNIELKKAVYARTADLEAINKQLRMTNEELERFTFITSHDLKEPLRNISSFTGLLQRRLKNNLDDETSMYFEFIKKNTKQMHVLIEDVMRYSHISNENNVKTTLLNVNDVVYRAIKEVSNTINIKHAEIIYKNLPSVLANEEHLILIFKNLIENGIKYNKNETPIIKIKGRHTGDGYTLFSVKDNGIGIEPEYHERIFKMFRRLHNRDAYSGSGLGLSLVKKLIERQGGDITVQSYPNKGSTFFFRLQSQADKRIVMPANLPQEILN